MIVTTDIANILFRDCKSFGIKTVPFGKTITGELKEECITIHVKGQTSGTYWEKCFVEVNLCVPNLRDGEANTIRLNEIERLSKGKFKEDVVIGTRNKDSCLLHSNLFNKFEIFLAGSDPACYFRELISPFHTLINCISILLAVEEEF